MANKKENKLNTLKIEICLNEIFIMQLIFIIYYNIIDIFFLIL